MADDDVGAPTAAGVRLLTLETDLAAPTAGVAGRHPLPTPESFAEVLGSAGIGNDDLVVAFDAHNGAYAARLVWMLRATGHEAALLGAADEEDEPAVLCVIHEHHCVALIGRGDSADRHAPVTSRRLLRGIQRGRLG